MKKCFGWIGLVVMLVSMVACGKKVPSEIIQPGEMENLLYDYHIAATMSSSLPYDENYKREAYQEYIFQKHHVTRAEFDSSMVWYTRNAIELADIYKRIQFRLEKEEEYMKIQVAKRDNQIDVSMSGDTVDVWQDRTLYWLTASELTNRLSFDLKADTTFKPNDAMELVADFHFTPIACPAAGKRAVMALRFQFDNDSVQGATRIVTTSGTQRLYVRPDSAFQLKSVDGFVYYSQKDAGADGGVLVNKIRLMRYHRPELKRADAPSDSVKAQSVMTAEP